MRVAIIGAGTMGAGIAQLFAAHGGYQVALCDVTEELAEKGKSAVQKALFRLAEKGRLSRDEAHEALERINTGQVQAAFGAQLIIEAAAEDMAVKKQLFKELQENCEPGAIYATNTSSLSVTELSAGLREPVIGMHFFNPAPLMKLVEIVSGLGAPPALADRAAQITRDIGKEPVHVKDSSGFVVNRILIPMINEAIGVLAEGTALAEDIDAAMKLGAGHPMGPLALCDLIGADICLAIMDTLYADTHDGKYRAHPLLRRMASGGILGRKSGKGFYDYSSDRT